ncbi:unnamed protein product [Notodromas monacha]|uniref:Uncharacterized protein n=1 Tax=Notodromas monacha TaxID=399045 RepID=A0A7R9GFS9_9CRUS|nr:unnamed protein product [Notodromas monacha]CAG0919210.1 unnamed protein product [Notodromas monacha]
MTRFCNVLDRFLDGYLCLILMARVTQAVPRCHGGSPGFVSGSSRERNPGTGSGFRTQASSLKPGSKPSPPPLDGGRHAAPDSRHPLAALGYYENFSFIARMYSGIAGGKYAGVHVCEREAGTLGENRLQFFRGHFHKRAPVLSSQQLMTALLGRIASCNSATFSPVFFGTKKSILQCSARFLPGRVSDSGCFVVISEDNSCAAARKKALDPSQERSEYDNKLKTAANYTNARICVFDLLSQFQEGKLLRAQFHSQTSAGRCQL